MNVVIWTLLPLCSKPSEFSVLNYKVEIIRPRDIESASLEKKGEMEEHMLYHKKLFKASGLQGKWMDWLLIN